MKKRWKKFALAAAILYAALLAVSWVALTNRAWRQTESMLDYAMLDLNATLNGSIDTMLMHAADSVVEQLHESNAITHELAVEIARQRGLDELNIVSRNGIILASNDAKLVGVNMADKPKSAEFLVLTNGVRHALSHPFRAGAHNPDARRKYVGVAFPDGNGFVQVGMDEDRIVAMFPSIMGFIFDQWLLGEKGFFLCADKNDGHLISNPARHRNEASFLSETGYDPNDPDVREDAKTTFGQTLFGDDCDCRAVVFCGYRIIAALPPTEYYTTRTYFFMVMALVLAMMFTAFVLLVRRIDISMSRIESFYRAENTRIAREFAIASTIQRASLPPPLPDNRMFALMADMQPAKEVGGDFYDFFMLDHTHLAFLVADVSGKGVTGALYMMTAKTLIKDAFSTASNPAAALDKANKELCANNPASMFLTVWLGVLDVESGQIVYANAGHNPPVLVKNQSADVSFVTEKSGPVLAFSDAFPYRSRTLQLQSGDALFLYTDGVTEALDVRNTLFGEDRLIETISAVVDPNPKILCTVVRAAVSAFAGSAPQADDITVMALRFTGGVRSVHEKFPPTRDGISAASDWLDASLSTPEFQSAAHIGPALHIILDEICANIVMYSGATYFKAAIQLTGDGSMCRITFEDDGAEFNPLAHDDPDVSVGAAERKIGGLGIMMVKKMSNSVAYSRRNGLNILTAEKSLVKTK